MARSTGRYDRARVGGEEFAAFIPNPLPPAEPPLSVDDETGRLLQRSEHELARLELASEMVPSVEWFIYGFVRKEAVISSQIEGTQATLIDLLTFEAQRDDEPEPNADVQEVCNYLDALAYARDQIRRDDGLPISSPKPRAASGTGRSATSHTSICCGRAPSSKDERTSR